MEPIPFNRPSFAGNERAYMDEALRLGHASGDGEFTRRCHELLARELGVPAALLTTSCTHALEMAALLLDIEPGDEVIVPSFTFVSTANAFALRGARPVFVDVRPDTLNSDERLPSRRAWVRDRGPSSPSITRESGAPWTRSVTRSAARDRRRRRQRPRPLRAARRDPAGDARGARDALLPRDEELQLRRRRSPPHQRRAVSRARGGDPGEGDQPEALLPRRGRQVQLGGPGVELPAVGPARRVSLRPARAEGEDPRDPAPDLRAVRTGTRVVGGERGRAAARDSARLPVELPHVPPRPPEPRRANVADRAPARPEDPCFITCPCISRRWASGAAAARDSAPSPSR